MKKYRTIVADPPWEVGRGPGWGSNGASRPLTYPTMTLDEIKSMNVLEFADKNCVLFLWTINKYLLDAAAVCRSWGFKPSTCLVWVKKPNGIGLGGTFSMTTEFCVFATKGKVDARKRIDTTWWHCKRGKHSQKPREIMEVIESVGNPHYLELFCRERFNDKWDIWGNELSNDIEVELRDDGKD